MLSQKAQHAHSHRVSLQREHYTRVLSLILYTGGRDGLRSHCTCPHHKYAHAPLPSPIGCRETLARGGWGEVNGLGTVHAAYALCRCCRSCMCMGQVHAVDALCRCCGSCVWVMCMGHVYAVDALCRCSGSCVWARCMLSMLCVDAVGHVYGCLG